MKFLKMFRGADRNRRLLVLFLLLSLAATAYAQAHNWRVADFKDTISIAPDGAALVSEKITVAFVGQWHGIHRTIPVEYPGPQGTNYTLFLDVISVTDENGNKLKYDSSKSGNYRDLKIYIPDAVDATRIVNIDYKVRNSVRFFDNNNEGYAEFYWNVTGNDWPVPIDHASAFVALPDNAAGGLRAQAFTGAYGSRQSEADSEVQGANVAAETTRPLSMRGGLTIDIYIPQGVIQPPSALTKFGWFVLSNPILFLPLLTLAVMFTLWYTVGRDPDPGVSVAPQYEPPQGLCPAEAGTLLDDDVNPRDITCTVVDLAVRKYIKIEEQVDTLLVFHHKDYLFTLLKPREQWTDLTPHERLMLNNIFLSGTGTHLSDLKNRFYTVIPLVREQIMSSLKSKGIYTLDPDSANAYSVVAAVVIAIPVVAVVGWMHLFYSIPLAIGSALISALIWWLFARQMTAKTVSGARATIAVLGFQEFLNRVDADRIKQMTPDTFERFLPYAMALGVEHQWAQAFDGIVKEPPSWYSSSNGYAGFSPLFFSSAINSMASDVFQVFTSAPRASSTGSGFGSSGGGFSGGGFSGGGFGGGGGGAF
jgi:uncharacterized membrane protein YgcG